MNRHAGSVESRSSWVVATVALIVLSVSYGAPLTTVVALKPIAAEFGATRSAPALAVALTFIGAGCGGIAMGWLAERIGVRWVVLFGGTMIGTGLTISSLGGLTQLYVSSFLFVGLLGAAGMFAPLMTYVSRWFDMRRGTAIALISAGQYVAGALWPAVFQLGIDTIGWRHTMLAYAAFAVVTILPLAAIFLRAPPQASGFVGAYAEPRAGEPVLGLPPNLVLAALAFATFCCCVTMSMPMAHMVAFCSDIGIAPTQGAAMLSVLLGSAFFARQFWGWLADRVGGLRTILFASAAQAVAMAGFLVTQDEIGLFTIAAVFGFGFGGLIPGYVLSVRELFPASEASWRIPTMLFPGSLGMAAGGWLAGAMYDHFAFYAPAFAVGVLFNLLNLAVIGFLVLRHRPTRLFSAAA
ncbi:MAG TPA: MFS transporter [Acetobacteraceae bacterium]|jgi:MFS family permease|nr:MFS transporter [Acetobacteraceae bacterium]